MFSCPLINCGARSHFRSPPPLPPLGMRSKLKHKVAQVEEALQDEVSILADSALRDAGIVHGSANSTQVTAATLTLVALVTIVLSIWLTLNWFCKREIWSRDRMMNRWRMARVPTTSAELDTISEPRRTTKKRAPSNGAKGKAP